MNKKTKFLLKEMFSEEPIVYDIKHAQAATKKANDAESEFLVHGKGSHQELADLHKDASDKHADVHNAAEDLFAKKRKEYLARFKSGEDTPQLSELGNETQRLFFLARHHEDYHALHRSRESKYRAAAQVAGERPPEDKLSKAKGRFSVLEID